MTMQLTVNGEAHTLETSVTLSAFLGRLGLESSKIAVERNMEIVPRSGYGALELQEGDRLEIVHFVGGG